jgi:hypothetical protein
MFEDILGEDGYLTQAEINQQLIDEAWEEMQELEYIESTLERING